ncbi:MAG: alpha/beta hydrolase [Ardenticatenaceae bacterium]|nr:alpha/beta hydrolase [Ardenticatenaceae bacterium]
MLLKDKMIDIGWPMHVRVWQPEAGEKRPYLLIHGLSSNARTWDGVARELAQQGHPVVAVDQRGHGLSHKPDDGYDFATITADLMRLLAELGWQEKRPILAGQSWGGNVLLAFGYHYPGVAGQLIFVDGGFLDLSGRGTWEEIAMALRPPNLNGTPLPQLRARIKEFHPDWSPEGIEATLANFAHLPDGTVRPWLSLDHHMQILRAMYEQKPQTLFPRITEPVLICVADDGSEWTHQKREQVRIAADLLPQAQVVWFPNTAHDIHVEKPVELARMFEEFVS